MMISFPLLKQTIKSNYKILIIFLAVLTLYFSLIINMYDPNTQESMDALLQTMPADFITAMGFSIVDSSLVGLIAGYLYGFLILLFPMIYDIIIANRMIALHVDKGSMAYLLSSPTTRTKIAITQAKFLAGSITIIIAYVSILGIVISNILFPGELDISKYLLLNLGALLLHLMISGISFFASCFFNDTKNSLAFGAGIPIAFLLIQMIANTGESLENLKYATLYTLFNPTEIISGASSVFPSFIVLGILAAALYAGGIYIFSKKDLPL